MAHPLPSGTLVDRYVIDRVIGEGGMATVYRVHHKILGQPYALKVMSAVSGQLRERVLQEGRVQGALHHPNIVHVVDAFEVDGAPALVMELVEGPCLADLVEGAPLDFARAERIFRDIVAGVAAAHGQSLIHRDLKPANILLWQGGGREVAKVTDFGIVKIVGDGDSRLTQTGAVFGTPAYMSPEQLEDPKRIDRRTDIFALGSLLYEMLGGHPPFLRKTVARTFAAVSAGVYPPLRDVRPDAPSHFSVVIDACLRVEMDERPADCAALLTLLDLRAPEPKSRPARPPLSHGTLAPPMPPPSPAVAETREPAVPLLRHPPPTGDWAHLSLPPPDGTVDGAATFPPPAAPYRPEPSIGTGAWLAAGAVGIGLVIALLLLVGVTIAATQWHASTTPSPPAEAPSEPTAEPAHPPPTPADQTEPPATSVAAIPTVQAPVTTPVKETKAAPPLPVASIAPALPPDDEPGAPEAAPAPAPVVVVAPRPIEPEKPAPQEASVMVSGSAARVEIRGGGRTWSAGKVPAGTYAVWADFDGSGASRATSFTVEAGQTASVRCLAETYECFVRQR